MPPPPAHCRWLFRSGINFRRRFHEVGSDSGDGGGNTAAAAELHRAAEDDARDVAQRDRLQPLWMAAAPFADRFSARYISSRFSGC
jgi:hypothetical protein